VEVVDVYLAQIARHNPELNAVVTLDEDGARGRELAFGGRRIHRRFIAGCYVAPDGGASGFSARPEAKGRWISC